ncbi:hypothetical protein BIW11_02907 [Tropilaelaps mercedesae]|uniref:Uncharacterized protein n=1 Tax=Tropilaelaps mercedesae TaxID=418985 RepID=A0A1V9XVE3_9ACAR|nr:hypothetical protein BIW11_02907 [Tropilaelaps mercedesae]
MSLGLSREKKKESLPQPPPSTLNLDIHQFI